VTSGSWDLIQGEAEEVLNRQPVERFRCCVTSPPYWGLRDYKVDGQLGLEDTLEEYVERMVKIGAAVRRVLTKDGTLWLNLGDAYSSAPGDCSGPVGDKVTLDGSRANATEYRAAKRARASYRRDRMPREDKPHKTSPGLKSKDLIGIPWRVAFALQADGWWLRSAIIWQKNNPMPESTKDRPTSSYEFIFLLARSKRYYYDAAAIAEPTTEETEARIMRTKEETNQKEVVNGNRDPHKALLNMRKRRVPASWEQGTRPATPDAQRRDLPPEVVEAVPMTRNSRNVWTFSTEAYPGAHFATFPRELPRRCLLAGSQPGDWVLDPFAGSGTTGEVARRLGRKFVGVELNPEYCEMARRRIGTPVPLLDFAGIA